MGGAAGQFQQLMDERTLLTCLVRTLSAGQGTKLQISSTVSSHTTHHTPLLTFHSWSCGRAACDEVKKGAVRRERCWPSWRRHEWTHSHEQECGLCVPLLAFSP